MLSVSPAFRTKLDATVSEPKIEFLYKAVDKSTYPENYGIINRRGDKLTSGDLILPVRNSDQSWNDIRVNPQNHFLETGEIRLWFSDIPGEYITLFKGKLESARYSEDSADLSFRDRLNYFTLRKVGSSESPVNYYSSDYNPADLVWDILTIYGGLSNITDASNPDIDYTAWQTWKSYCTAILLKLRAKFTGQSIIEILSLICKLTASAIYTEGNGKIRCAFWLDLDTANIFTYDETRKGDILLLDIDRTNLINRYMVSYGYNPEWVDGGTATGSSNNTLVDTAKSWTVNAHTGRQVKITAGTGAGQTRDIASNTANTLTVSENWKDNPSTDSVYEIDREPYWTGSVTKEDTGSQTEYGLNEEVFDNTTVWHSDIVSATAFADRGLDDTKNPKQECQFTAFLSAFTQQINDAIKVTDSFHGLTNQGVKVENLSFNVDNMEVTITGRLVDLLFHFFILDSDIYGILDDINRLM